jgi:hypothetical protein
MYVTSATHFWFGCSASNARESTLSATRASGLADGSLLRDAFGNAPRVGLAASSGRPVCDRYECPGLEALRESVGCPMPPVDPSMGLENLHNLRGSIRHLPAPWSFSGVFSTA